ncbi:MAG TPA: RNA-binding protein, partial [Pyrodictium sp.]|nr:RNA-binding protein [Pyrodictium sp.]
MLIDKCNVVLVKTVLGMENVAASYIEELDPNSRIFVAPYGLKGLIIVEASKNKYELAKEIEEKVPEAEKVLVAEACARADLQEMA